jgi:hypothetical protein
VALGGTGEARAIVSCGSAALSLMRYAFDPLPNATALQIATQLGDAMDLRSHACLLMCAAYQDGARRRVTLWTFPKDEAPRLRHNRSGPSIDYLEDVFSRNSKLRKAALLRASAPHGFPNR